MARTALAQTPRPVPTALAPAPIDHAILALNQYVRMTKVIRLAYVLPEAEFAALLDDIEQGVTRIVLDRLRG